jgi:hypothetical protein
MCRHAITGWRQLGTQSQKKKIRTPAIHRRTVYSILKLQLVNLGGRSATARFAVSQASPQVPVCTVRIGTVHIRYALDTGCKTKSSTSEKQSPRWLIPRHETIVLNMGTGLS